MNRVLEETMIAPSRFSDATGAVKIKELCKELDLDQSMLVKALGTSRQTVSHYLQGPSRFIKPNDPKVREFWVKLDHVFTLLLALTDEKKEPHEIRKWLHTRNKALRMERPVDLVYKGELDTLIKVLMDVLNASHGG
jgi:DNA-binding XRE family transcriptional regulator